MSDQKRTELLEYTDDQLEGDRDAEKSILKTWHIIFDYIQNQRPSAAVLLSFMSFCDPQEIPDILFQMINGDEATLSDSNMFETFQEDQLMPERFSLISLPSQSTSSMHALVQLGKQYWLKVQEKLEMRAVQYVNQLNANLPWEDFARYQKLLPHATKTLNQESLSHTHLSSLAILIWRMHWYWYWVGNAVETGNSCVRFLKALEELGMQDNPAYILGKVKLADAYCTQERFDEAQQILKPLCEGLATTDDKYDLGMDRHLALARVYRH